MSETGPAEQPAPDTSRLKEQARNLRRSLKTPLQRRDRYSMWQKLLVLALLLFSVGGSLFALLDGSARQKLIARVGEEWTGYFADREKDIFKLPPPPPRRVEPRVIYPSSAPVLGGDSPAGTIYSAGESPGDPVEKKFVPPPKTPEAGAAFNLLKAKSDIAGKLAAGELAGWTFKEWKPVQLKPPEYFIDLVAVRAADSAEVHLVWSVNVENERIAPLSQAARDLETGR